ncbi:MAG: hypothetical protein EWV45_00635 [Microcystis flos-aquae Mf_QC_C_20070823_S10D]|uniref:Uncharacterized protein n=1 Tax=Microcystis flos-aquae Mf_QC_C_20070823_S10D TaxID=2486236 RepID=A0A552L8M4_9CHRO|nr:MAG: hypothetical protein EWV65_19700 [Microcystis flos-aquae Ma_QC_C_20070823_S18D]TRV16565.1 MAG: hypothetical protein EWV45_00635 [Microcystis flos-aquae Mf_QC_C_20070823_S10D]TRV22929.1 MAG: hypothetical protein EWV72_14320 [Microcystis flos-aquae Mf_QC_C_20070823_S10]TRV35905.1 MAG: hypothetical protein EWV44_13180 [Microcystis flos-aquae Mf_QC_C_20070823_S20T]TRV39823.1 MAG: hypothetical protein EWV70_02605 [Microcystis flos-aquae Mf_QC_C_20070823_S20]TRV40991.1 MAG: hypothetical prot
MLAVNLVSYQESGDRRLFYLFSPHPTPHTPHPTPHTPHPTPHTPSPIYLIYGTTRIKYRDNLGDY